LLHGSSVSKNREREGLSLRKHTYSYREDSLSHGRGGAFLSMVSLRSHIASGQRIQYSEAKFTLGHLESELE
jgi:hypothetical protein